MTSGTTKRMKIDTHNKQLKTNVAIYDFITKDQFGTMLFNYLTDVMSGDRGVYEDLLEWLHRLVAYYTGSTNESKQCYSPLPALQNQLPLPLLDVFLVK